MNEKIQNYSQAEKLAREEILDFLKLSLADRFDESLVDMGYPPQLSWGNFAIPCFLIAKKLGQKPDEASQNLAKEFETEIRAKGKNNLIDRAQGHGPYLNFFVNAKKFNQLVLRQIINDGEQYGRSKIGDGQKVMVEFFSPNTNKPLTVGHLRNIFLGWSISQILKKLGFTVIESTLYNDRGIAICKAMVAYQKWGAGQTPESEKIKPDQFVGNFYTMFHHRAKEDESLEKAAQACLQLWEKGDRETKKLWRKIIKWSLQGFDLTLKKIGGIRFDIKYSESKIYALGKDIIFKGLESGIFKKHPEGYIYAPLEQYGLPDKILLRSDGTSLYVVQDIYLATLKNVNNLGQSIYVVGSEQELAFKQLFKILEMLGEKLKLYHLSYGMMRLPQGKIKSREGLAKGTAADDLIDELDELATKEIIKRDKALNKKELAKRAHQIALAALKYYILEVDPKSTMVFDPKKSLSFAGKTGPYLQYVHARISSILRKTTVNSNIGDYDFSVLAESSEKELIGLLARFPTILEMSAYDPSKLAHYLYELAKSFSTFYQAVPVLKSKDELKNTRLILIRAVKIIIANGLELLGIKPIERM